LGKEEMVWLQRARASGFWVGERVRSKALSRE
jgi:hypothetical protein